MKKPDYKKIPVVRLRGERAKEMIEWMMSQGMSAPNIAKVTGLHEATIRRILKAPPMWMHRETTAMLWEGHRKVQAVEARRRRFSPAEAKPRPTASKRRTSATSPSTTGSSKRSKSAAFPRY